MINNQVLDSLVKILKKNKVRCGIGGSFLLQLYNLYDDPQDIDFWVYPDDLSIVKEIFCDYPQIEEKLQLPEEYHLKICYEGVFVDFVACFIVQPNKNKYQYNLCPESIEWIDLDNGVEIPCTSLEDWYIVYKLLNRNNKADIIKSYLESKNRIESDTYIKLNRALKDDNNKLPQKMKKDIRAFEQERRQITIYDCI